jgi:glycerate 2-kinase
LVVAAPDKLKGVLAAAEAADAVADGFERLGIEAERVPLADGGEGTADALLRACGGEWRSASVEDAIGRPVTARFALLDDGRAVVESAEAIGLWRLRPDELDPLGASSRGLGQRLRAAVDGGARSLVVALGGVATTDGGAGLREVVRELPVPTTAVTDVRSPLLGPRGAAHAFAPQKGATPEQVAELERRLASIVELRPFAEREGAGAAGGLGAALMALGAGVERGLALVLDAVGFDERIRDAALVVTGEGAVDATSVEGKVVGGVVERCVRAGVRCVAFGGIVTPDGESALRRAGARDVLALSGNPSRAREDLIALAERLSTEKGSPSR